MIPEPASAAVPSAPAQISAPISDPEQRTVLLNDRIPGQSVIAELLAVRELDEPRSLLGRIFGADPLSPDSRPWYKGALGEIAVGRILARLGHGWTVLHAVPVGTGASDVDHVLIGPAGVFTLNTKNHSNQAVWVAGRTFMVAGKRQPHIPKATHEAARAAKLLTAAAGEGVEVTGVLVIVEPKSMKIREKPEDVAVVTDRQLLRWLNRRQPSLAPEQVARISAAAVLPGTWHRRPQAAGDAALQQAFDALKRLVDAARLLRTARTLTLATGLVAALINLVPLIAGAFLHTLIR